MPSRQEEEEAEQAAEGEEEIAQPMNEPIERLGVSAVDSGSNQTGNILCATWHSLALVCPSCMRCAASFAHMVAFCFASGLPIDVAALTRELWLQEMGIAAADIKKLKEASYHVIEAVAHATKRELLLVKGLSEAKVNKIKEAGKHLARSCRDCLPGCCRARLAAAQVTADGLTPDALQLAKTATWASSPQPRSPCNGESC